MYWVKRENNDPIPVKRKKCLYVKDIIKYCLNEDYTSNQSFPPCELIYDRIILNHEKPLQFYKISSDKVIYMGPVEEYILKSGIGDKDPDVFVEVVVQCHYSESIFLIMKQNDNILKVKEIVARLIRISSLPGIYDINGFQLEDFIALSQILKKDSQRIFISWTPDYLHRDYNRYLIEKYFWYGNDSEEGWIKSFNRFLNNNENRFYLRDFKTYLERNRNCNSSLNRKSLNALFETSEFYFCKYYSEFFYKEIEQKWKCHIKNVADFPVIYYFIRLGIFIALQEYYNRRSWWDVSSMNDIIIKGLELLLQNDQGGEFFIQKFIKHVCVGEISGEYLENEIENYFHYYGNLKIKMTKSTEFIKVPLGEMSLFEIKKLAQIFCGIDEDLIYFVNYDEQDCKDPIEISANMTIHLEEMTRLKKEQKRDKIGEGSYGKVYLFKEANSDDKFAIKIFNDSAKSVREININEEIKYLELFPKYRGLMSYNKKICAAFSLFEKSLDNKIKITIRSNPNFRVPLISEKEIIKLAYEILIELKVLHKWKILHLDIKPENILLDKSGRATLCDYGCSKLICNQTNIIVHKKPNSFGTQDYEAPEISENYSYSDKADIWSLGIVIIEMIEGKLNQYAKHKNINFAFRLRFISENLRNILMKCLTTDPAARSSAEELLELEVFKDIQNT